ncbi:putative inactive receptor kinase [Dendrobium catenatum]|uniref:Putative inactive receptor kinase n=1 Tax=Dendrobium catenatum TaxID=906689 RepID=A0A2I0XB21_9ASPA|nr:putative inactive receptor kinase [Dendrobium catenatum]
MAQNSARHGARRGAAHLRRHVHGEAHVFKIARAICATCEPWRMSPMFKMARIALCPMRHGSVRHAPWLSTPCAMALWGILRRGVHSPLTSVWVDSKDGRFFQKVEYENVSNFCFVCGKIGHVEKECVPMNEVHKELKGAHGTVEESGVGSKKISYNEPSYGPWILVKNKKKRISNQRNKWINPNNSRNDLPGKVNIDADQLEKGEISMEECLVEQRDKNSILLGQNFQNSGNLTSTYPDPSQEGLYNLKGKGCLRTQVSPRGLPANSSIPYHNLDVKVQKDVRKQLATQNSSVVLEALHVQEKRNTTECISENVIAEEVLVESKNMFSILQAVKDDDKAEHNEDNPLVDRDVEELELEENSVKIINNQKDLVENSVCGEVKFKLQKELKSLRNNSLKSKTRKGETKRSIQNVSSTTIKSLNLSSNSLTGHLPSSLGSCTVLDLSKNMLSGNLVVMQNWDYKLEVIKLSSNMLAGSLPSALGKYPKLSIVDLSLNQLTGSVLPSFFTSLTLTSLNLSGNQFNGSIPLQASQLTESILMTNNHLQSLDLSNNSLSGSLPPEISTMTSLNILILGKNSLSGKLPIEVNNLHELEVLDLSLNHFIGAIPDMIQLDLKVFNVSYNDLSGEIPQSLLKFPLSSFRPGNTLLDFPNHLYVGKNNSGVVENISHRNRSNVSIRIALIVGSIGAVMLIFVMFIAFHKIRSKEFCVKIGFGGEAAGRDALDIFGHPNRFSTSKDDPLPTSTSFSNDHLLTSASRSLSAQKDLLIETVEYGYSDPRGTNAEPFPGLHERKSSRGSPPSSSTLLSDSHALEQPVLLDVCTPDRLAGELFFLDTSLIFTAEELSRAPAEVLGRSSHGTSYRATLDNGHMLTVKWLRVGLVKHKKDFAKEAKRVGTIRHPNIISWRGYYWGPREQERLIISDYIHGDSLALYLYDLTANLTDYGLHRLLIPSGIAEQILHLGALGYRAPELSTDKPLPSFKGDVYSFGVVLMELLTRKSAGDIISGQPGAVDLTDWVQMCTREGRGTDCFDRDIAGLEESPRVMDELLAVSLKCILPVNERPNIQTIYQDLISITMFSTPRSRRRLAASSRRDFRYAKEEEDTPKRKKYTICPNAE